MELAAPDSRVVRGYRLASQVIGWVVLGAGLLVLVVGWWLGVEPVRTPIPGAVAMKANTAFAFVLVGLSLVLYCRGRAKVVAVVSACLAILLGIVNLAEYLVGAEATRFDTLLGADLELVRPGRMAVLTAVCFAFLGVALVSLLFGRAVGLRQGIGVVVGAVSLSGVLGYILGNEYLTSWGPAFSPIAFNTAALLLLLGPAVIMAEPTTGWARVISSPLLGGRLFRTGFLPLVVIIVVAISFTEYVHVHLPGDNNELGDALSELSWLVLIFVLIGLLVVASISNDRTDQKRQTAATKLSESEQRYRLLAENATDVVWQSDADAVMVWVSPSIETVLGWAPEQLVGTSPIHLVHPDDTEVLAQNRAATSSGRTVLPFELRLLTADGRYRWLSAQVRPIMSADGAVAGGIVGLRDIEEEVLSREALAHAIEHDRLTGLATLPVALARIDRLLGELRQRAAGRTVGVLCVGIDSLKQVNEALTHAAGDRVIVEVAIRIASVVDSPDLLARGDGDEFLVLVPELTSGADASAIAERISVAAHGTVSIGVNHLEPTVSIGIATGAADTSAGELVRDAALAMGQAKDHGRDRWEFFDAEVGHEAQQRVLIEAGIREGLADGQFVPWFQPVVNLADGTLVGYEALVRWVRPDGGIIAPDGFLPVAERTSLICDIDLAVLAQSLEMLATLPASLSIAVNISAATLASPKYAEQVIEALPRSGIEPARLHLEFTETAVLAVSEPVHEVMNRLAGVGVRWYVDDFGTGYSSIAHLRGLPIAGLKLDLSFTQGIGDDDPT
ncbi:MAG: EAL domain-containing protein, partial [Actinomycetes bacterium]